jgi:GNAT superfamily N-acetyltransferase/ABC-type iron transport system FetAB ATPase subunit
MNNKDYTVSGFSYDTSEVHTDKLKARRWFIPRHLDPSRFPGLEIGSHTNCAESFELKPTVPAGRTMVASYVGEPTGDIAPGLEPAEELLDTDFDGICCHALPTVSLRKQLSALCSKQRRLATNRKKNETDISSAPQDVEMLSQSYEDREAKRAKTDSKEDEMMSAATLEDPQHEKLLQCEAGHALKKFKTQEAGYACDECKKTFPKGTVMQSCRQCEYDLCSKCSTKKVSASCQKVQKRSSVSFDKADTASSSCPSDVARPLRCHVRFPQAEEGVVVVVLGPSGSGKSSLVRHQLGKPSRPMWKETRAVMEHFADFSLAEEVLYAAHLPLETAMAPYGQLSRGEQSRADLARVLAHGVTADSTQPLIVEEFTSLLDRATAKSLVARLQAFLRRRPIAPLVLVSCHEDFVGRGMLEPQCVFETRPGCISLLRQPKFSNDSSVPNMELSSSVSTSSRKRRASEGGNMEESAAPRKKAMKKPADSICAWESMPRCLGEVKLEVRRAMPCEWQFFREFHYKDHTLHASSMCWVGVLDGHPVAFTAAFPFAPNYHSLGKRGLTNWGRPDPGGPKPEFSYLPDTWIWRIMCREHRTVVLPDYQGTGVGSAMSDAVARDLESRGFLFTSQTIHPFFGSYRERSPFWRPCASNRAYDQKGRPKYAHYWVGATSPKGVEDAKLCKELDMRVSKSKTK